MAGVNVGGNLSGMQLGFIARTPSTWMNRYTLDGVDITDMVFGAGSSIYYDFDAFNVLNANTVLVRQRIQNSPTANQVTTIVAPRVIRLGLRASW